MNVTLERALIGGALALLIALAATRMRSLSPGGACAAVVVGTVAAAAGWSWAILLIVYFASSSALSRWGRAEKERRTSGVVAKGGERDAVQVFANGGVFTVAAIAMLVAPNARFLALAVGSLAASAADTWATEIGTRLGGVPRSIITSHRVAPGMSGGVSVLGTLAAVLGAAFIALIARLLAIPFPICAAAAVGGFAGATADSVLGGMLQSRRWCPVCERITERTIHDCGAATEPHGGVRWLNNDSVNFACTAIGGLLTAWMAR